MSTGEFLGSYESKTDSRRRQYDLAYMDIAKRWAQLSHCKKKQVGAIVVKDRMIISDGFNGCPTGFENTCEDEYGKTHWYTLHAEANAILKLAASTQNSNGATLYITCSPCGECAKLIYQSGIVRVVYADNYKTPEGVEFLKKAGISIHQMSELKNNLTDILDAFELELNSKFTIQIHKTINKAHVEKDFDSINESIIFLLQKYADDVNLLRTFMVATNSFKEHLPDRNRVYSRIIQICDNNNLNCSDFLSTLK